jgi:hypothetical protein
MSGYLSLRCFLHFNAEIISLKTFPTFFNLLPDLFEKDFRAFDGVDLES